MNEQNSLKVALFAHKEKLTIGAAELQWKTLGGKGLNNEEFAYAETLLEQLKSKDWQKQEKQRRAEMLDIRWRD